MIDEVHRGRAIMTARREFLAKLGAFVRLGVPDSFLPSLPPSHPCLPPHVKRRNTAFAFHRAELLIEP